MGGQTPIKDAFLELDDGRISRLGARSNLNVRDLRNFQDISCYEHSGVILPGFLNAHCHLSYGRTERSPDPISWLESLTQHSRSLSEAETSIIIKKNAQDSLRQGTTTILENTPWSSLTQQALCDSPLKILLAQEIFAGENQDPELKLAELKSEITKIQALAPHSLYSTEAETLRALSDHAQTKKILLTIHVSEFPFERESLASGSWPQALKDFHQKLGFSTPQLDLSAANSPVGFLDSLGLLSNKTLLVHALELTETCLELVQRSKAKIISCPRSNAFLQAGFCSLQALEERGIDWCIATDGLSSNLDLDLLAEIKTADLILRARGERISAEKLFESITSKAALCMGVEDRVGALKPMMSADFLHFDLAASDLAFLKNALDPYEALLQCLDSDQLQAVWIEGVQVI